MKTALLSSDQTLSRKLEEASIALAELTLGRLADAGATIARAERLRERCQNVMIRQFVALVTARVHAANGRIAEADSLARAVGAEATRLGLVQLSFDAELTLAIVERAAGRTAEAEERLHALAIAATARRHGLVAARAKALQALP